MVDDAKKLPHPEYPTRYERTPKMEQQIRKEIGDGIYPLLESHGFLRKNNHFARVFGSPQMLQVISIDYRHFFEPMICATIHPLYLFSACWKTFSEESTTDMSLHPDQLLRILPDCDFSTITF